MEEKKKEEKKKGIFGRIKEATDDKEEQIEILSTFVRLGILVWSGGILTLAYIQLPPAFGIPEQKLDPTFIASVFTGVLATFGVQAAKKAGEGGNTSVGGGISKEDVERLIEAAGRTAPSQTIRLEQTPVVIKTDGPPVRSAIDPK